MNPWLRMARLMATLAAAAALRARADIDSATRTQLEALTRLKDTPLASSAAGQQAVARLLEKTKGEPEFIALVRDFKVEGREADLSAFAAAQAGQPPAVDALRLLLGSPKGAAALAPYFWGPPDAVVALMGSLGDAGDSRLVPLVAPLAVSTNAPLVVRRAAARALARVSEGAAELVALERAGRLSQDLKFSVGNDLRAARWPGIRQAASELFPAPKSKNPEGLPPLPALLKVPADAVRGAAVFRRADIGCINCHQVNGEGVDFGPKLSEIGAKLGKDALSESILDPSAGIAFGYEAWNVALRNGDEIYGLIVSETDDEVTLKAPGGIVARRRKSDIVRREKQTLSAMPAGLQENMSVQDFADLLEYLAGLKKAVR